ncbi:MAG: 2-amino-4-hydroxy-6-hydroxymethyldihydropteridine diphosphokinase [Actinomycetales bacterium]
MKAVIALGANLGDPRKQISIAIDEIRDLIEITAVSSLYETTPVGVPDNQPNYINAVLIGQSELKPLDLMVALLNIENSMGRHRSFPNAARTIDIDIIEYGGLFMESQVLTLPHPRAHERRFVLEPWFEIEPDGELAGHGPIRQLLSQLQ